MTDFQQGTKAVVFDLDGVIADSEPLHQVAFQRLFTEQQLQIVEAGDWHRFVGTSDRHALTEMIQGQQPRLSVDALLERKGALFLEILAEREPLYPGVADLIESLAARYQLAVASGSLRTAIAAVLAVRGLRRFFGPTVSVQDVERGKPAPDLYLRAAELLGIRPEACVAIEDSIPGVAAARAAGMRVIAISTTTPADRLRDAHVVVGTHREVGERLLGG